LLVCTVFNPACCLSGRTISGRQPHRRCGWRGSGSGFELTAALKQVRELQRLLGKKTMEVEILKEAVEYGQSRKWIAHAPLLPKDGE
jgi:hypothetical protein